MHVRLDRGEVVRVDPRTNEVAGSVEIGGELCQGLGVSDGTVWSCRGDDIVRLDFEAGQVTAIDGVVKAEHQGRCRPYLTGSGC